MANPKEVTTQTHPSRPIALSDHIHTAMILGGDNGEWALIANLALMKFVSGEEPYLREFQALGVKDPESILPDDGAVIRQLRSVNATCLLLAGESWTGTISTNAARQTCVQITAASDELGQVICKQIASKVPAPPPAPDLVSMVFWHHNGAAVRQTPRRIEAPPWDAIQRNYPAHARHGLDRLMKLSAPSSGGRLILLHGEPGTGKTTALRALARAWASWCRADYIVDADRLFASPSYLLEVITNQTAVIPGAASERREWRLLIVEDCDELIRADAKANTGQALSRLLNVTDGMLGQGLKILFCITTNEDLQRLHSAVTRPGRCLANIAVDRFERREAIAWLGGDAGVPAEGATLAELYALGSGTLPVEVANTKPPARPVSVALTTADGVEKPCALLHPNSVR